MTKEEALKLALWHEAMAKEPNRNQAKREKHEATAKLIKEALAKPDQEPVAWMFQHEETGRTVCIDAQQLGWGFEKGNPRLKKIAPLYTIPSQPTQVKLTDDEIWKFWWSRPEIPEGENDSMEAEFVAAVRAVLAAHGIKE